MNILAIDQGSDAWLQVRKAHFTASEAPAALGQSRYVSRTALLHQKATGISEEIGQFKQALFDKGHQAEAAARVIAEQIIEGDLYPITATLQIEGLDLLSSLDGATMDEEVIWEHKLYSEELAKDVRAGTLAPHYTIQMDQQLLVSGAKKCLFMTSDGTEQNMAFCWYEADQSKFAALIAGWKQFAQDLESYVPPTDAPQAVGRSPETLPALRIEVTGMVTASNLEHFKEHALAVFGGINRELTTDTHFADAEKTVKWCADIEDRLKAAKQHALSQTETIDALFRAIDEISGEARATRLELEKLVKARKDAIRTEILQEGVEALQKHVAGLNTSTMHFMPHISADFAGAMRGKKTVASLRDAVATTLANAKIEANAVADRIRVNLETLRGHHDYAFLFADIEQIVLKQPDDLTALVKLRIAEHKEAEAIRLESERQRIAEEERRKAEAAVRAEQKPVTEPAPSPAAVQVPAVQIAAIPTPKDTGARIRLGEINSRIAPLSITAEGLAQLGFPHVETDKSAKLYRASDFEAICGAMAQHVMAVANQLPRAA